MHVAAEAASSATNRARGQERSETGMNEGKGGRTALRAALAFGIVAATIEMGIVLWFMYC